MIDFLIKYNDVLVFLMVVGAGRAGAYTQKEILKDRFKAIHGKYEYQSKEMCFRCWEIYPCADLQLLGVKK